MNRARTSMATAGVVLAALFAAAPLAAAAEPATAAPTTAAPTTGAPTTTAASTTTPTTAAPTTTAAATALEDPFAPVPRQPGTAATVNVSIIDFGFSPASVTVAAGSTVTWTNNGAVIHSVTSDTGAFDSSPSCPVGACINPGSSYSHVFAQAGTFAYHCKVHTTMTATVVVNAAATTTAPPTTAPGGNGNPPTTDSGSATTAAPGGTGAELAFTGTSGIVAWLALGALAIITLGLALRPRRRPFPDPS
jgi:plastocyanin